jgi:two-component system chemotaxis response regulator CheB
LLLKARPGVQIVMASTLTRRNAEISLKALSLGAADYVPKPESNSGVSTSPEFRRDLVAKVRALGARGKTTARSPHISRPDAPVKIERSAASPLAHKSEVVLANPCAAGPPACRAFLAIGSSTGGPQALAKFFATVGPAAKRVPIVVTQHMPATFTAILAENLGKASGLPSAEGSRWRNSKAWPDLCCAWWKAHDRQK